MDQSRSEKILSILRLAPVIPVVIIERLEDAVPLARALVEGGLPVIEITLRTPVALDAIRAIAAEVPQATVGAGTVLDARQMGDAITAGARFLVSPGASPHLLDAAEESPLGLLPGVATAGEAMMLMERGYRVLKFFPAEPAGGAPYVAALASPLAGVLFCPTGGITADSAPRYLALPNVVCVGGSWLTPRAALEQRDFTRIERLARDAARLKPRG